MPRRKANNEDVQPPIERKKPRVAFKMSVPTIPDHAGTVLTCGQGDMGQLGLGDDDSNKERKRPCLVGDIKDVVAVRAGGMHNLCLTKNGEIYSFGCNDEGALGRDTSEEGSEFTPGKVNLSGKCVKISAGDSHSACLMENGSVFAWGSFRDSHGNMGLTMDGNTRVPIEILPGTLCCDIASGTDHLVILTCFGKVYTVGCAEQGQLGRVALRSSSGETRRGKSELLKPGVVMIRGNKLAEAIWATSYCTFVREKGTSNIWAFGLNNYKQLAYPKVISVVTKPINIKCDDVNSIAGGQHHTLLLKNDSSCYAVGRKDYGRLGLGELTEDVNEWRRISSLDNKNIVSISCGEAQSFALTNDGKLYAWGMGTNLQLGTGTEDDVLKPTLIVSKQTQDKHILQASSGGQHSIFLVKYEISKESSTAETIGKAQPQINESTENQINNVKKIDENLAKAGVVIETNGKIASDAEELIENATSNKGKKAGITRAKKGRKRK